MSTFRARAIVEFDIIGATAESAAARLREHPRVVQIIGVIPADQPWPTEEEEAKPFSRPPRNTPPSGSPGTPTLDAQPEIVEARAA